MPNNNPNYVTAHKPKISGSVFAAPLGTQLPTDAVSQLSSAYINLGHVDENGVPKSVDRSSDSAKDWNGDTVLNLDSGEVHSWKIGFMETLNPEVKKIEVGDKNVEGDFENGMSWHDGDGYDVRRVYVIDTLVKGGVERMVIPCGVVTAIDTQEKKKTGAAVLPVTITGYKDANGKSFYGYAKKLDVA